MPPDCRKTHLKFKLFRGSMSPDPPSIACLLHATCLRHVSPKFRSPTYISLRLCTRVLADGCQIAWGVCRAPRYRSFAPTSATNRCWSIGPTKEFKKPFLNSLGLPTLHSRRKDLCRNSCAHSITTTTFGAGPPPHLKGRKFMAEPLRNSANITIPPTAPYGSAIARFHTLPTCSTTERSFPYNLWTLCRCAQLT